MAARTRRTRPRLPADQRGYGPEHRAARAAAIAAYQPGQPCANPHCRRGGYLLGDPRWFDLGHEPGTGKTRYRGLEHRYCNRSSGATYGNQLRGIARHPDRTPPWITSRRW
jgi:hypothetical protein